MEYDRKISDRDVWVTVLKPLIWSEQRGTYEESAKYCSAFKFDQPPLAVAGGRNGVVGGTGSGLHNCISRGLGHIAH